LTDPTYITMTPKQELFAQAVASGKSQAEAYRAAYDAEKSKPETVHSKASVLMANGKVAARVAELRKPVAERAQITLESHLRDLESLRDKATKDRQYSAAITAEIARGKAAGVHVEKSESLVTTRELPAGVDEFV
jgi:phage terminase small subunit